MVFAPYGADIIVVLVDSLDTVAGTGDSMLMRLTPFFPTMPIMLISVEDNGFRAYATFQTGVYLALLQLDLIVFHDLNLNTRPPDTSALPF